jgi:transcriptional regulator of acetoin/glycerol metabolism
MEWKEYLEDRHKKMKALTAAREARQKNTPNAQDSELARLTNALTAVRGDVTKAAEMLGISRATAFRKVRKCDINVEAMREAKENGTTGD